MLKRVQAVLMTLLLASIVWMGVRDYANANATTRYMNETTDFLQSIRAELAQLRSDLATANQGGDGPAVAGADDTLLEEANATLRAAEAVLVSAEADFEALLAARDAAAEGAEAEVVGAEAAVQASEAKLIAARAQRDSAEAILQRAQSEYEAGEATDRDLQEAKELAAATAADVQLKEAALNSARAALKAEQSALKGGAIGWKSKLRKAESEIAKARADIAKSRRQVAQAETRLAQGGAPTLAARKRIARADLTGAVTDAAGAPLADADVLLVVKTWPNNRFRQDDYAVKTDASGAFVLEGKIPLDGQYGVNAVVVAAGHAISSRYVLVEDPAGEPPEELAFELGGSTTTKLTVTDSSGAPLANAMVAPSGRLTDDEEHLVYFQGSRPAWKKTDAEGNVEVDWFAPGDLGKINVRPRGGDWQERQFNVPETGGVTVQVAP